MIWITALHCIHLGRNRMTQVVNIAFLPKYLVKRLGYLAFQKEKVGMRQIFRQSTFSFDGMYCA